MSKAKRIIALLAEGKTVAETAEIVGCLDAYVRVVRQRHLWGGQSIGDRVYAANNRDAIRRRELECARTAYHAVPTELRKQVFKDTRSKADAQGLSKSRASNRAVREITKLGRQILREQSQCQ